MQEMPSSTVCAGTRACLYSGWKSVLIKQGSENLLCIINLNLFFLKSTSKEQPKKATQYVLQALLCASRHSRQVQNVDFGPKRQVVKTLPELNIQRIPQNISSENILEPITVLSLTDECPVHAGSAMPRHREPWSSFCVSKISSGVKFSLLLRLEDNSVLNTEPCARGLQVIVKVRGVDTPWTSLKSQVGKNKITIAIPKVTRHRNSFSGNGAERYFLSVIHCPIATSMAQIACSYHLSSCLFLAVSILT